MTMTLVATLLHERTLAISPPDYRLRLTVRPLPAPDGRFRVSVRPAERSAPAAGVPAPSPSEEDLVAAFPGHDDPTVRQVLAQATIREYPPDAVIVREGDRADAFYVLLKGSAVVSRGRGAERAPVATLRAGEWFGEVGLLQGRPRNATVSAGDDGAHTLVIDDRAFGTLVATSDFVAAEIGRLMRKRVAAQRLAEAAPQLGAEVVARRLPDFGWRQYAPGQPILREGDAAEEFFVIVEGHVEVTRHGPDGQPAPVARLGPGECFGEVGLLRRARRNATVTAIGDSPVVTLVTDRRGFERLVADPGGRDLADAMLARVERLAPGSRPA
jgi:CRP-like cAMP-binding protein